MARVARAEAIATLEAGQVELDALFGRLSADDMVRPATIGGGAWSARDLLGHIAFWEELALEALADWRAGRRPATEGISDEGAPGTDAANARNQERTVRQSLDEVRQRADSAHRTLMEAIGSMSDDEWDAAPPYPKPHVATLGELLGGATAGPDGAFRHAYAHLADLRACVERVAAERGILPPSQSSGSGTQ
jgi:hypothetical protein